MNKLISAAAVSLILPASAAALAVEEHHPDQKGAPAKSVPKDAKPKGVGMPMGKMQDNMLKMHEQMHKIMQAKDPRERERLMQEHLKTMQENMKMMGGMMGGGMMGPGMMRGGDGTGMLGGGLMGGGMGGVGVGHGMMGDGGLMGPMAMLDLSDEQRAKIRRIEDEQRKKNRDLYAKIEDESVKLRDLYGADTLDAKKIGAVYDKIFDLKREVIVAGIEAHNKARAVLTKEQQDQLKSFRRGGMGMGGYGPGTPQRGMPGPGMTGPGGMMGR